MTRAIEPAIEEKAPPLLKEHEENQVIPVNTEVEHMVMELWKLIEECAGVDIRKLYK
jgi:hypothetical protein